MTKNDTGAGQLPANPLAFNGIDGSTGKYLTPGMSVEQIARVAKGGKLEGSELKDLQSKRRRFGQKNYITIEGVDPNDLAQAGWAAVFPAHEPGSAGVRRQAEIREVLAPLLDLRRAQVGRENEHRYREYAGALGYQAGETKQQYLTKLGIGPGPADPDKVPYYLCLIAGPEEIPYRVQYQLSVQYAVGRIHFDTVEQYASYARSVVDVETGRATARPRRAAFFAVENPGDQATAYSRAYMAEPLAESFEARLADEGWSVERYMAEKATHAQLGDLFRDPPALLFTASHGVAFPNGYADQRKYQGALLCQDWDGPEGSGLERGHYFAGEDIDPNADLRGMIGFCFACFGMGTPRRDDFAGRAYGTGEPGIIAPVDFVAQLPQRMLGHPKGGALAAVGHIDRAWGSSFLWAGGQDQTEAQLGTFQSTLTNLFDGKTVGYALEYFDGRYAELASYLVDRVDQARSFGDELDDNEMAQLWLYTNDARNYAIVGDPAVRLYGHAPVEMADIERAQSVRLSRASGPAGPPPTDPRLLSAGWFGGKDDDDDGDGDDKEKEPGVFERLGRKVTDTLSKVLEDAVTLEVKTYVSPDIQRLADGEARPSDEGSAQLRAYTRCALDGDTEVFVPTTRDGQIDENLWKLHLEMVKQAQEHRAAMLETVVSLLTPLVKK